MVNTVRMEEVDEDVPVELRITFKTTLIATLDENPSVFDNCYVRRFIGIIELVTGEDEETEEIGEIEVWCIDGGRAMDCGLDIVEVCDSISEEALEYASSIYADDGLDPEIVPDPISHDVLVLHKIAIKPAFRGFGYGLKAMQKIVEIMGSQCGAAVIRPAPLQFSPVHIDAEWMERMGKSAFTASEEIARQKLVWYWNNLGLKPTNSEYFYCIPRW